MPLHGFEFVIPDQRSNDHGCDRQRVLVARMMIVSLDGIGRVERGCPRRFMLAVSIIDSKSARYRHALHVLCRAACMAMDS
ncbi:hypothetical protein [Sorangium sp. So ce1335]|uniref:hypothetical protein n=1 Tax=Sorangium sp. So ce1335 TaxID=3133335 RepID=UPI003F5D655E